MTLADLVADSEDEEYLFRSKGPLFHLNFCPPSRFRLTVDFILLLDLLQPRKTTNPLRSDLHTTATVMADNAVASTSRGEMHTKQEVTAKKPRPKPKKRAPTGSIDAAPSAPPSDFAPPTTAVPMVAVTMVLPELTPQTESRPQDIPLTIADRAKSRVRHARFKPVVQDVIDIPSDEDERLLQLSPHRPGRKDGRGAENWHIPDLPPSIHPSQESLVVPTSDYQPAPAVSSQLPPSDPPSTLPLPTSTPESAKKRRQVAATGDIDESPLNLSKKRKRRRVVVNDEDDNDAHVPPPRAMATVDQPPPNFFASSSSSLPPPPAPVVQGASRKKPAKRKKFTDDAFPPDVANLEPPKEKNTRSKPKQKSGVRPDPSDVGQSPSVSASTSRSKVNARDPAYKSAEIVDDSDKEADSLTLPLPPHPVESQSPLSDLSEPTDPGPSKPVTPSSNRKRLVPEVLITTVPKKRASSPSIREVEEEDGADRDGVNGSPKGKKRQKQAVEENYFDGLDEEVEAVPKKGSKGKGKALPKGKSRTKHKPKEAVDDEEFGEGFADGATGTSRKAKSKVAARSATKKKPGKLNKSRTVESDDEVTVDASAKDFEVALVDGEQTGDSSMAQQNTKGDETLPPQNTRVSIDLVTSPEPVLICNSGGPREYITTFQARQTQIQSDCCPFPSVQKDPCSYFRIFFCPAQLRSLSCK